MCHPQWNVSTDGTFGLCQRSEGRIITEGDRGIKGARGASESHHPVYTVLLHRSNSVIMKYAIIAALCVFALAQGSLAQDASQDLAKLTQYFEEAKNKMMEEMNKLFQQNDLANQAQTMLEGSRAQLEAFAPQMEEHLKTVLSTVEEQVKPLQAQVQPILENFQREMETITQKLTEKAKALAN
ncbi:hypothetical protein WMY93_019874 [Mugilogobius chulae]|uniref:Uncharacterized protein n=1 Tax=Mugilogobius chulae TaxID=88201 RepID=A0AAW0NSD9_9GOBI